jgi:hypothetical protein
MKPIALIFIMVTLTGCRKDGTGIYNNPQKSIAQNTGDSVSGKVYVSIKLYQDSVKYDETMIVFSSAANSAYSPSNDALYFPGFGQVSLSSLSSDGRDLAINTLPYRSRATIALDVNTKYGGQFFLAMTRNDLQPAIKVWLKDSKLKDSISLSTNTYSFMISKTDTNSYGKKRFKLLIQPKR